MIMQGRHLHTHQLHIATSTDENYFNRYFDRWHSSFTRLWSLPMHCHVVDPSPATLTKLSVLAVSHTWSTTNHINWPSHVQAMRQVDGGYQGRTDQHIRDHARNTLCQSMRFHEMSGNFHPGSSVVITDIDAYAQHQPSPEQWRQLLDRSAFSHHKGRLMATLCHFHGSDHESVARLRRQLEQQGLAHSDQAALKSAFGSIPKTDLDQRWIRHWDIKSNTDMDLHRQCLVFHAKGTRGKFF